MFRLMGGALALAAAVGAAEVPVVRTADVVVVGGSSAAVSAAIAAKEAGAEVFLIAPRPYLGEDVAGTLRVVRDPGDDARAPLFRALFDPAQAGRKGLSYAYTTDVRPNAKIHSDPKGVCLTDGRAGHAAQDSVQFDGDVTVTADLGAERDLAGVRLDFYVRLRPREGHWRKGPLDGGFLTQAIRVSTSVDGRAWSEPVAAAEPEDAGEAMRTLAAPLAGRARYVRVTCVKDPTYPRQLLAELRILPAVASAALAARTTPFLVKRALDKAMLAAGVPYLTGAPVCDVVKDADGRFAGVVMANRSGRQIVRAKVLVRLWGRSLTLDNPRSAKCGFGVVV